MIKFDATLHTNGKGFWTTVAAPVRVEELSLPYVNDEETHGELLVKFDVKSWDVDSNGDIYTDPLFLEELKAELTLKGFDASELGYSEYGMQRDNCVSLDVGPKFIASWLDRTPPE